MNAGMGFKNKYVVQCVKPDGSLRWEETVFNLVTTEGLNDVLQNYFKGAAYTADHYMGLKTAGSIVATDTLAALGAGTLAWDEYIYYTGDRQPIVLGTVANGAVDNADNRANFVIDGDPNGAGSVVAGIMVATVATGTTGVLFGAVDFPAARTVLNGDTLIVTVQFTMVNA